ncbi:hypothetical protein Tco_1025161 [Tanacetum coccineum]
MVISESLVRSDLFFNDEDGIAYLTNDEIFENLALMGYEQLSTKLTFQKGKVTPLFDNMLVQNQAPEGAPRNHGGVPAQTRSERVLEKPNEPPLLEGHTSGSGEGSMEHTFELADNVPNTPHNLPLSGEEAKTAQDRVITKLKLRVKRLEKKRKARTSQPMKRRLFKGRVESSDDKLDEEDASKQGRTDDKTKPMFQDSEFDKLDDDMDKVEEDTVNTTTIRVSDVSAPVTTASTPVKIRSEKAKVKGIAFSDVAETPKLNKSTTTLQPLPTIDPKDKGKGVLVEEEPEKPEKVKRRDQIESDAELAQRLHEEELAEFDRAQKERQKQEEATSAALAEEFDEIQARIDADHELAKKETIGSKKSKGNKEQTTYKNSSQEQDDYLPQTYGQQQAESTKKRQRAGFEEESSKKQKLEEDNDAEKEELRDSIDVAPRDDVAINVESLATKYLIVNWKTHILNENMMYYQIIKAGGSSKNYKIFNEMLNDFDRQDVIDLHRLVNKRYKTTSPGGYDLLLWRDLKTLFEPNKEDEIWKNQQDYNLISWRLFDSCGVHVLLMNTGVAIHMMIKKKYPLTQEMLLRMLNRRLEVDYESEMAFELLRFTRSQLQK